MIKTDRPKIKAPFEDVDIIIELLSIIILILMWVYVIIEYANLPEIIPSHFNAKGEVDGFANKYTLWFLPIIATVLYIGIFILNKFPYLHNYMVNITEDNALKNYKFSTRVLRIINFLCVLLFAYILYSEILTAKKEATSLGPWALPIILSASFLLPIVLIIYQNRINKN